MHGCEIMHGMNASKQVKAYVDATEKSNLVTRFGLPQCTH